MRVGLTAASITGAAIAAVLIFLVLERAQPARSPAQLYYVALGDSNAHGRTADGVPDDPQCVSPKAPGYVCVVYRFLRHKYPGIQLRNFSRSGADSCEVAGTGRNCTGAVAAPSQLIPATSFLTAHRRQVRLVTINIGGNDILELAPLGLSNLPAAQARLPAVYAGYRTNLATILVRLRGAAPGTRIIASTQWNPLGGLQAPPLPAGFPETAQTALDTVNHTMIAEAPAYHVKVADAAAVMNAFPGGGVELSYVLPTLLTGEPNIHPTPRGHRIWGKVIIKTAFPHARP